MDHWIYLLGFLRVTFCLTDSHYVYNSDEATFEQAVDTCKHKGFLTDMADSEEVGKIISKIEISSKYTGTKHVWVGLRKSKSSCVSDELPLKGFEWIANSSNNTNFIQWKGQLVQTCTGLLCGRLNVEYNDGKVTDWGLNGSSCKDKNPFICRLHSQLTQPDEKNPPAQACEDPVILGNHKLSSVEGDPFQLNVHCLANDFTLNCSPDTKQWYLASGSGEISQLCFACNQGFIKDATGTCVDIDECERQPCGVQNNCINQEGSYICDCNPDMGYMPGKDSKSCEKRTVTTEAPASSTTQFSHHTNLTPHIISEVGSPNASSTHHPTTKTAVFRDVSDSRSSILIPVLVAVLALVIVVVIISVTVKCCLRRKSKNVSGRGKSKETVVLKAADSDEHENLKEIV